MPETRARRPEALGGQAAGRAHADRGVRLRYALQRHQQGAVAEAERLYRELLIDWPEDADVLNLLGVLRGQRGELHAALELADRSLSINPRHALAHANRARVLLGLGRAAEALASAEQALRLAPQMVEALLNRAAAQRLLGNAQEALEGYRSAIALQPSSGEAFLGMGYLLVELRRPEEALESFAHAQRLSPTRGEACRARARALLELYRFEEALAGFEQALRLAPGDGAAWEGRGLVLRMLGFAAEAIVSYDRALESGACTAECHAGRAAALHSVGRVGEAAESWERALALNPDYPYALGDLLYSRLQAGEWTDYAAARAAVETGVGAGRPVSTPFALLAIADLPELQLRCAQAYFADRVRATTSQRGVPGRAGASDKRISLGYLSADFREHATARLLVGVLERHERSAFAVTALSCGPDDGSALRERVRRGCDRFVDLSRQGDRAAAELIRGLEIDILVDLNGFAAGGRPGILTQRPAPLQVGYLGYPGTLGSDCLDYLVADSYLIPAAQRACYAEQIAYLPNSYQANDRLRPIPTGGPERAAEGLPAEGLVFCCFNAPYKITPQIFELWMRLLGKADGSVLWLYRGNAGLVNNLRREAVRLGVVPERLIFAEHRSADEHLARCALADLFLDTLPVNAHTTASDALWAGVPVLTCSGQGFAARVAGSLLHAVGLPELVTQSVAEYERRALQLAADPAELSRIRRTLAGNRLTHSLFDTDASCRGLERAYRTMWERWLSGKPPATFTVGAAGRAAERDCHN